LGNRGSRESDRARASQKAKERSDPDALRPYLDHSGEDSFRVVRA